MTTIRAILQRQRAFLLRPFQRSHRCFADLLEAKGAKALALVLLGCLAGWWVYVPLHELTHGAGCVLGGGSVERIEIKPAYGGRLLARLLSVVSADSDYAGRVECEAVSDWNQVLTVFLPYLFTPLGVALERRARRRSRSGLAGAAWVVKFSPAISLPGDFLELGGLLTFQAVPGRLDEHRALISDDLFLLLGNVPIEAAPLAFVGVSLIVGTVLAWGTVAVAEAVVPGAGKWERRGRITTSA